MSFKNPLNPNRVPVHPKAVGGGAGGAIAGAIIYLIQTYWIKNSLPAGDVSLIYAAVGLLLSFGAAYLTPARVPPVPPAPTIIASGGVGGMSSFGGGGGSPSATSPGGASGSFG